MPRRDWCNSLHNQVPCTWNTSLCRHRQSKWMLSIYIDCPIHKRSIPNSFWHIRWFCVRIPRKTQYSAQLGHGNLWSTWHGRHLWIERDAKLFENTMQSKQEMRLLSLVQIPKKQVWRTNPNKIPSQHQPETRLASAQEANSRSQKRRWKYGMKLMDCYKFTNQNNQANKKQSQFWSQL